MQKLKFSKDEGSLFYKDLKARLDAYFTENKINRWGDRRMIAKIVFYFGADVLFYVLMLQSSSKLAFFSFYLLMGISVLLTAFNISHDAAHGVAVRSRRWNRFLFGLSFQLQGNNAYVWGRHHNESHHLYTNIEGSDIDVVNNPLVRTTTTQQLRPWHRYQHWYTPLLYMLYSINWAFIRETLMLFQYSSRTITVRMPRREVIQLVFFKLLYIVYAIVVPAVLFPFGWKIVLLAFLLNHAVVSLIFTGVLAVSHLSDYVQYPEPEEDGTLSMSWPKLQMVTSVDYNTGSRFCSLTLGGFNAHALHHLLPNISHVHYRAILPIFRQTCRDHGLPYMELRYGEALRSHFRFLKALGRQESPKPKTYEEPSFA
jgi:linoleoyl-CoA desaturase